MAGGSRVGRLVEDMLKRALFVVATCVGLALYASLDAFGLDDPPPTGGVDPASTSTGVKCNRLACGPNAYDEGSPPADVVSLPTPVSSPTPPVALVPEGSESGVAAGSTAVAPDPCPWMAVDDLGAGSSWWGGNDPTTGHVEINGCLTGPPSMSANGGPTVVTRFVPNAAGGGPAAPPPPPPPTPEELAKQAYNRLPIPDPSMKFGPDSSRIAVNYWLYLWVDDPGPVTATAAAGAVSVTAVARLSSVTWTMGEPVAPDALSSAAAPITCQGPGSDPGPSVDTTVDPAPGACAYMYKVRSTPERTGGSGTWPVTATANWTITWAANTGQAGTLTAPPKVSTTRVSVGAWSTVLVADGASGPGG